MEPPRRVGHLRREITVLARDMGTTERRLMALFGNVVVAQVLPDSAIKGGTGLRLRLGERLTRETPDLDTAYRGDLAAFRDRLAANLATGWAGFSGTVTMGAKRGARGRSARVRDAAVPSHTSVPRQGVQGY